MLKPAFAALAAAAQPQLLWAALVTGGAAGGCLCLSRSAISISWRSPTSGRSMSRENSCLTPFFIQPTFQIFSVVHEARCISPAG